MCREAKNEKETTRKKKRYALLGESVPEESSESSGINDVNSRQIKQDADDSIKKECLSLEPGLTRIMQNSRDYDELLWAWTGWHNESGRKMRSIYTETVEIQNKAARQNKYEDLSEYWIDDFEDNEFEKKAADLFEKIKPLYRKIHAYVRGKLENFYGNHYPESHDPELIPAHLLGKLFIHIFNLFFVW